MLSGLPNEKKANFPPADNRLGRSISLALAGALGVGALGFALIEGGGDVRAETQSVRAGSPIAGAPASFAGLVSDVRSAVVSVHVTNGGVKLSSRSRGGGELMPNLPKDHPFYEFFKRFAPENRGSPTPRPNLAQGSGFVISRDGYVVTNNHVVDNAAKITVTFDDRSKLEAELVGADPRTDLALLKIKSDKTFKHVQFTSGDVRVGDWVIAAGNPFGLSGSFSFGIVSARGRDIGSGPYDYIQTDAAVNRGNSGGPLFNLNGEVVGVNTAIYSPSGGNHGVAFAVPAKLAADVISELKRSGAVSRGWLGVHIQSITEDIAASLGMEKSKGALISKITKDGPASKSELQVGDAIVEVNGGAIQNSRDLARKVAELSPGSIADVKVVRDGRSVSVDVQLGTFPGRKKLAKLEQGKVEDDTQEMEDLGLSLAPARNRAGVEEDGVVITKVEPGSNAEEKGLRAGDIILEVAGETVEKPNDVVQGVRSAKDRGRKAVLFRIKSGEQQRFIALPLKKA